SCTGSYECLSIFKTFSASCARTAAVKASSVRATITQDLSCVIGYLRSRIYARQMLVSRKIREVDIIHPHSCLHWKNSRLVTKTNYWPAFIVGCVWKRVRLTSLLVMRMMGHAGGCT